MDPQWWPDIWSEDKKAAKRISMRDFLSARPVSWTTRRVSPFSNTLVLPGFSLYEGMKVDDPKKLDWKEYRVDLRGRDLEEAMLTRADLKRADLTGARLRGAVLPFTQLQNASLDDAQLHGASLFGAQLEGRRSLWRSSRVHMLWGAQLAGTSLERAQLQGASLYGAQLAGASLEERSSRVRRSTARSSRVRRSMTRKSRQLIFPLRSSGGRRGRHKILGDPFSERKLEGQNLAIRIGPDVILPTQPLL